jgi:F-type H+-transporting ATPase subunit b
LYSDDIGGATGMEILGNNVFYMELIPPEMLAKYIVTAFFVVINLFVTYIILKLFLFKPTIQFLEKRRKSVEDDLARAKSIRSSADEKLAEASARNEESIHEATNVINDARIQAQTQGERILDEARKEADQLVLQAEKDIERTRTIMMEEMRDEVADLSIAIASKVIKQNMDESKQRELIDRLIGDEISGKGNANVTE